MVYGRRESVRLGVHAELRIQCICENDLSFQIEVGVAHAGGLDQVDLADLHQRLNRTLLSAVGYRYPVEGLQAWLT